MIPLTKRKTPRHHHEACTYTKWPTRPELMAVLLLNIVWRLTSLLSTLESDKDNYDMRERKRDAMLGLTRLLGLARSAFYGMTGGQYRSWVKALAEEQAAMAGATRRKDHPPLSQAQLAAPLAEWSSMGPEARRLLVRLTGLAETE